jgi:hypothetical protein
MPSLTMRMAGGALAWACTPGAAPGLLGGAKGGWGMRKLMESLRLLLTKMRRLVTRQR